MAVSAGALLTKNLTFSRSRTSRAATNSRLSPGRSFSSLSVIVTRFASQTIGPLSLSLTW